MPGHKPLATHWGREHCRDDNHSEPAQRSKRRVDRSGERDSLLFVFQKAKAANFPPQGGTPNSPETQNRPLISRGPPNTNGLLRPPKSPASIQSISKQPPQAPSAPHGREAEPTHRT